MQFHDIIFFVTLTIISSIAFLSCEATKEKKLETVKNNDTDTTNIVRFFKKFPFDTTNTLNVKVYRDDDLVIKHELWILASERVEEDLELSGYYDEKEWDESRNVKFFRCFVIEHPSIQIVQIADYNGGFLTIFEFMIKYSSRWSYDTQKNSGDGQRFMIINGKFLILNIDLWHLTWNKSYIKTKEEQFLLLLEDL